MKKFISIGLVFIVGANVLIPGLEIEELTKIPALINHFREHQEMEAGLSFLDFLKLHYNDPEHHSKDPLTHHELPFSGHHAHNCQLHQVVFTLPDVNHTIGTCCQPVEKNSFYTSPEELTLSASIWQPPRNS